MRLVTVTSVAAPVVSIAVFVLVLGLYEELDKSEPTSIPNSIVLTEPTPTPFVHKQLLSSAQVKGVVGGDLTGADLTRANLTRANLTETDLSEAELFRAELYGADLRRANLRDADLTGTILE